MDDMNKKDDIGHLIRDAGARETVSTERFEAARARVAEHWQEVVAEQQAQRQSSYSRSSFTWYTAAAVVGAVVLGILLQSPDAPVADLHAATVNRVIGDVRIDGTLASAGASVDPGNRITTGDDGMLALDLASGQSLRIGKNTNMSAQADNRFSLANGQLYVDSDPDSKGAPVFIETSFGTATHIGTQFLVLVEPDSMQIGVREGLIELDREDGAATEIGLGTLFTVSAGRRDTEEALSADDEIWQWTSDIAPSYETDGASLSEYLNWYSRQAGVKLHWFDEESQSIANDTLLDGSIDGLSLEDGLRAVHKIAPFEYTLVDGIMTVRVR